MRTSSASNVARTLGVVAIGILTGARSAAAGVSVVTRESTILAAVITDQNTGARLESADGLSTFGVFDKTVTKSFDYPPGSLFDHSEATASQKSSVSIVNGNLTGAQVSGEASGLGLLEATGVFSLLFDVTGKPVAFNISPFELRGGEGGTPGSGKLTFSDLTRHQVIRQFQSGDTGLPTPPEPSTPFDPTGVLQPGRYHFQVEYGTKDDFGFGSANVGLSLTPSPEPVPLPPAVWPGLAALAGCFTWTYCRGRLRAD